MKKLTFSLVLFTLSLLLGCSSIFNGSKQIVAVTSTPKDALIFVNGTNMGSTPATIKLKRGENHIIEIRKDGYRTYKITTDKTLTGWFWGNLICGGVVGIIIDLATGNGYDVDPEMINALLEKGTGQIDNNRFENFGGINIKDIDGHNIGTVNIDWE